MEKHELVPHPAHPPLAVSSVSAKIISYDANWLCLRWRIENSAKLIVPKFAGKARADDLWQATCFELFLKEPGNADYTEFNLSPSEQWAAFDFTEYRGDRANRAMVRSHNCTIRLGGNSAIFDGCIPTAALPTFPSAMGVSAVIEEGGGVKSYWALAHPSDKPDFHDPTCFTAELAAPEST